MKVISTNVNGSNYIDYKKYRDQVIGNRNRMQSRI